MKYIFLDIDGVFNSDIYDSSAGFLAECAALGLKPTGPDVLNKAHHLHLDPAAIKIFNYLVEKSGAKVILSSSWRIRYSIDEMNAMLQDRGATFEIDDVTPARMSWRPRGRDIAAFLSELKREENIIPEAFVILDDINEFSDYPKHFVQTAVRTGLTQEDVGRALKILGIENE